MSKQKERGKEGSRGDGKTGCMGSPEGKKPAEEPAIKTYLSRLRVVYGLLKKQGVGGTDSSTERPLQQLHEEAQSAGPGDPRRVLWDLFRARSSLLKAGMGPRFRAERVRAELAADLCRRWRAGVASKPYSMGLIRSYVDCVSNMQHGSAMVSIFLHEWFAGPTGSCIAEEWLDPLDEQLDKEEEAAADRALTGSSKKERLLARVREMTALLNQHEKKLGRAIYFEKAAHGLSANIMQIAEQKQQDEEYIRQTQRSASSLKQEMAARLEEEQEKAAAFVKQKLSNLPLESEKRIQALLDLMTVSEKEFKSFLQQEAKPQGEDKGKDKDRAKSKPAEVVLSEQLLRAVQQSREQGTWLWWCGVPPSQARVAEEEGDLEQQEDGGDKGARGQLSTAGKGGKGKAGKGSAAGAGKGTSSKGPDAAKPGGGDAGDGSEDPPRRLTDVAAWLQLLNKDVATLSYTFSDTLPLPASTTPPSMAELWTGSASLVHAPDEEDLSKVPGTSPETYLSEYQSGFDEAAGLLFPGTLVAPDTNQLEHEHLAGSQDTRNRSLFWLRRHEQASGLGLLLDSRGLDHHPLLDVATGASAMWNTPIAEMSHFQELWSHEDYQSIVSVIQGKLLPDRLFSSQGGTLSVTPDTTQALEHLAEQRQAEEVRHAGARTELQLGDDAADGAADVDQTLLAQLRLDVVDVLRLLRDATLLTPLLQRAIRCFLAACCHQHGQSRDASFWDSVLADDGCLAHALSYAKPGQLQLLRTFVLTELGARREATLVQLQSQLRFNRIIMTAYGPDLNAPAQRNSIPPLRMPRDTLVTAACCGTSRLYNSSCNAAHDQFQELNAESSVLPLARWPACQTPPALGTPAAEEALVNMLFDRPSWYFHESAGDEHKVLVKYEDLIRFMDLAAYASAQATAIHRAVQEVQGELRMLSEHLEDDSSVSSVLHMEHAKLQDRVKQIKDAWQKALGQFYQARAQDCSKQLDAVKGQVEAIEAKLELLNARPKVKEGASKKGGTQAQPEKREDVQQLVNDLDHAKQGLTDCLANLTMVRDKCQAHAQQYESMSKLSMSSRFSRYLHNTDSQEQMRSMVSGLGHELDECLSRAHQLAMLAEVCLVNAHHVAAILALTPPFLRCNAYAATFLRLWRFTLSERIKEENTFDLIMEEEAAKAKSKVEAKKKEGSKANKKAKAFTVKAASDDDADEEPAAAKQVPPAQPLDEWQVPDLIVDEEPLSDPVTTGWDMGEATGAEADEWEAPTEPDLGRIQRTVIAELMAELGVTEDSLYETPGVIEMMQERMERAQQAHTQKAPAKQPLPQHQQQRQEQRQWQEQQRQQQQQHQWQEEQRQQEQHWQEQHWQPQRQQDQQGQQEQLGRNRQGRSGADSQSKVAPVRAGANRDRPNGNRDSYGNGVQEPVADAAAAAALSANAPPAGAQRKPAPKEHVHARKRQDGTWEMVDEATLALTTSAPAIPSPPPPLAAPRISSGSSQLQGPVPGEGAGSDVEDDGAGGRSHKKKQRNKKKEGRNADAQGAQAAGLGAGAVPGEPKPEVPGMWSDEDKPQQQRSKGKGKQGRQGQQGQRGAQGAGAEGQEAHQQPAKGSKGAKLSLPTAVGHPWPMDPAQAGFGNGSQYGEQSWPPHDQGFGEQGQGRDHAAQASGWHEGLELGPPSLPSEQPDDFFDPQNLQQPQQPGHEQQHAWQQQQQQQQERHQQHPQHSPESSGFPSGAYGPAGQMPFHNPWQQEQRHPRGNEFSQDAAAAWYQRPPQEGMPDQAHSQGQQQGQGPPSEQERSRSEGWAGRQGGGLGLRHGALPSVPDPNLAPYAAPFGFGGPAAPQHGGPFYGAGDHPGPGRSFLAEEQQAGEGRPLYGSHGPAVPRYRSEGPGGPFYGEQLGGAGPGPGLEHSGARAGSAGMLSDRNQGPGGPFYRGPLATAGSGGSFHGEFSDRQAGGSRDRLEGPPTAEGAGSQEQAEGMRMQGQAMFPQQQQQQGGHMPLHASMPIMMPPHIGPGPGGMGAPGVPGSMQAAHSTPNAAHGMRPGQLPPHLLAANVAANLAASGQALRHPVLRPPLIQPNVRSAPPQLPSHLPGAAAPGLPGPGVQIAPPLQMFPMGIGGMGAPGLQATGVGPAKQQAASSSGEEEDSDGELDVLALCGVAAPAAARAQPVVPVQPPVMPPASAPPVLAPHSMGIAPPMPHFPPPMSGGSIGSAAPLLPPGLPPWQAQAMMTQARTAMLQQQQQQQQQATPTSSSGSAATSAAWAPKPMSVAAATSQLEMDDPGPAGFVGVVDEQEYPELGGAPQAAARQAAAPKSWAKLVSKAPVKGAARDGVASTATSGVVPQDDDEDEELQRALQESKMTASATSAGSRAPSGAGPAAGDASRESSSQQQVATGLVNRQGEYNCFLNVIIQCLWHCVAFRKVIEQHHPDSFQGQPVAHSLAQLFRALSNSEQQHAAGGQRTAVDPTHLREALDVLPNHNFRIGEMNDPSEVLTAIYECLTKSPQLRTPQNCSRVDQVVGLELSEQLQCHACGKISHAIKPHIEYFHIVQATALRNMAVVGAGSMASMLQELESQNQKKCDRDLGGCDHPGTPFRWLLNKPQVFTLLVAWEEQVSGEDVRQTLDVVDTELMLKDVYDGCRSADKNAYRLHSMFCYYGQHYHAFIFKEEVQQWVMFDDAHVANVGTWQDVIHKCTAGRLQPLVLFYQIKY